MISDDSLYEHKNYQLTGTSKVYFQLKAKLVSLCMLFISMFLQNAVFANDLLKYGTPYIHHFTKKEYKAGGQNWSITQDNNGFIYVANSNGLLQYDGLRWRKYQMPGSPIIRSVYSVGDRIYSGALGEFGYWENDANFNLTYTSLSTLLGNHDFGDEEIWWITRLGEGIIFQTFSTTFYYDGETVRSLLIDVGVIFPPFEVNEQMYIQVLSQGIYKVSPSGNQLMLGSELLIGMRIKMMVPFGQSDILIGTENDGFFLYRDGAFTKWNAPSDEALKLNQINKGIKISDNLYAVGSILGGLFLIDGEGEILAQINKNKGLNNNTVLSLMLDESNNLWVGLDNGLDLLKINSPLYYNKDVTGTIGSVYTSAIYNGYLYLGTNRGVFYKQLREDGSIGDGDFTLLNGSQDQVWKLAVIDGTLFCGHNKFTFIIENNQLRQISNVAGGYEMMLYPFDSRYIVQGAYSGLSVYEKRNGQWQYSHRISGFNKLSRIVAFERENVVWVSHPYQGLFRLELSDDLQRVIEIRSFSLREKTYVNSINNKLVFSSDSGFVYYDEIQNNFFLLDNVNKSLGNFALDGHFRESTNDNYWIFKDGECARAIMDENSVSSFDDNILKDLSGHLIPGHENVYVIDSIYTMIYLDNGYAIFDDSWEENDSNWQPKLFIRELYFSDLSGENYLFDENEIEIPYQNNNVYIKLSYPEFTGQTDLIYKIEGYDDRWNKSNFQDEIALQNLPFGTYTLHIKPEKGNAAVKIPFRIRPPWYKSTLATIIYVVLVIAMLVLIAILNRRKIKRIHEKHERERKRILEKEATENEKKLIKLRNESLRSEIKLRNSRLAKSTFSLIHKNNTLTTVKYELTRLKDELGTRFPSKHYNKIVNIIDKDITSENDWKMFEQSFSDVHENFLQKLKEEYPSLTPADLRLCAYLKMNLSSKEIASLLNISVRGVEIRRYRLRKKLAMEHDTNLVEFIMSYQ